MIFVIITLILFGLKITFGFIMDVFFLFSTACELQSQLDKKCSKTKIVPTHCSIMSSYWSAQFIRGWKGCTDWFPSWDDKNRDNSKRVCGMQDELINAIDEKDLDEL